MDETTRRQVFDRAHGLCEYCHLPQSAYAVPFEIDHVIAKQHHGRSTLSNLAPLLCTTLSG
jgi:5-methylcytosine-specific restriction endonuclease McrA